MRDSATLRFLLAFTAVWTVGILTFNVLGPAYQINAMERFSVFAQIANGTLSRTPARAPGEVLPQPAEMDMSIVASIPASQRAAQVKNAADVPNRATLTAFQLVYVTGDRAIVKTKTGLVEAKVGDQIPGAGTILELKRERRAWILITDKGMISDSNE